MVDNAFASPALQRPMEFGADVVAFTGFTPNALQQCASICLYTVAEEQSTRSAAISSTSAQLALTQLEEQLRSAQQPNLQDTFAALATATANTTN